MIDYEAEAKWQKEVADELRAKLEKVTRDRDDADAAKIAFGKRWAEWQARAELAETEVKRLKLNREKEAQRIESALLTKLNNNPQFRGGVERAVLMVRCGPTYTALDSTLEKP